MKNNFSKIDLCLYSWYIAQHHEMPWRQINSPYKTWISEIMLQQTQVKTVKPYYLNWIKKFPTVKTIANSNIDSILKAWEGLGYYSRARNLHKAAQVIVSDFNGKIPSSYDELQMLPGIGPYCAAAITSIAFGQPVPVVDGNVIRVFTRFWGIFDDIRQTKVRTMLFERLDRESNRRSVTNSTLSARDQKRCHWSSV